MYYSQVKVYFDGSHYIGTPPTTQSWKKRKNKNNPTNDKRKEKFNVLYEENKDKPKSERKEIIVKEMANEFENEEQAKDFVKSNFERKRRNDIERRKRLYRKVYLQQWNYFCTFTYGDKKINEFEFRKRLTNCLRHLANRKGWKYVGVWERSPLNNRLHFHALVYAPQMVGTFETKTDYSTENTKCR